MMIALAVALSSNHHRFETEQSKDRSPHLPQDFRAAGYFV
jgi:hypothetical protein